MTIDETRELLDDIKGNIIVRVYSQYVEALEIAIKALEQKPHNAEFVPSRDGYDGHVTCNNCFKIYDWDSEAQYFNYCPNCGADMRGDKNGNINDKK